MSEPGAVEHALKIAEEPEERLPGGGLGGLAVPVPARVEQGVRPATELGKGLGVAAEREHVPLDPDALILERALEPAGARRTGSRHPEATKRS